MKKIALWRSLPVFELIESLRIYHEQWLLHIVRHFHKVGNRCLPIAELPNSIKIPPENLCDIHDDFDIAIMMSHRHIMKKTFTDINATFHAPEHK